MLGRLTGELRYLDFMIFFSLSLFVYEAVRQMPPLHFYRFKAESSVHLNSTRQASKGYVLLARKDSLRYGLTSVHFAGANLWLYGPAMALHRDFLRLSSGCLAIGIMFVDGFCSAWLILVLVGCDVGGLEHCRIWEQVVSCLFHVLYTALSSLF